MTSDDGNRGRERARRLDHLQPDHRPQRPRVHRSATQACPSRTASFLACQAPIGRLRLQQLISYQAASRSWAVQWYEAGIFPALALARSCFGRIRRPT